MEDEILDLEELSKQYEDKNYFKRLSEMMKGLSKPKTSREYKLAKVEFQRLAAPLLAITVTSVFVIVLMVLTANAGKKEETIDIEVQKVQDPVEELAPEEDPPPPEDIEPPPEEVDVMVDTPNPGPITDAPMTPTPPSQVVSVKPAPKDTVAFVNSPVKMNAMEGSRTPGSIGAFTRGGAGYGDPTTEAAVMKVLWWLKATQNTDGSWGRACKPASTALAVLSYLAHGEFPGSRSPYKKDFGPVVQNAVDFLLGCVYTDNNGVTKMRQSDGNEYAFLMATYALCEAYGMTKNPDCKDVAMQCLNRIIKGQSSTGGWQYKMDASSTRDDLSYGGWAIQAMKAGKMAGLHPEGLETAITKAISCLKKRNYHQKAGFTYTPTSGRDRSGLAGVGVLAMQLLGYGNDSEAKNGLDVMRDWKPAFTPAELTTQHAGTCPQYYCYYTTQCKYQAGMKPGAAKSDTENWHKWNADMKKLYPKSVIDLEEKVLDCIGQEHKQGYYKNEDQHKSNGEYVIDSCLVALQLMVYYRYLPTTQVDKGEAAGEADAAEAVDKSGDVGVTIDI